MKTQNLSKQEAEIVIKNGGKVFLDNEDNYLYAVGINKEKYIDQTGFSFTEWFHLHSPNKGWNIKLIWLNAIIFCKKIEIMKITKFDIELNNYDIVNGCVTIDVEDEIEIDNGVVVDCVIKVYFNEVSRGYEGDNSLINGTREVIDVWIGDVDVEVKDVWSDDGLCVTHNYTIHQLMEIEQLIKDKF